MQKSHQILLIILAVIGLAAGIWLRTTSRSSEKIATGPAPENDTTSNEVVTALPPVRPGRFLNTSRSAKFIGTAKCAECHPNEHASYLRTPHSGALGDIDLKAESWGVEFKHPRSNRKYEVIRKADTIWHRETLLVGDGNDVLLAEYPVHLTIGSGHHSRSYLVETDGFLLESPVTWYASKKVWAMSPGYEVAHSRGFERVADFGCVHCHAGRVEPDEGNRFRVKIHDQSISCESCHGPGSLHAVRHKSDQSAVEGEDLTIVNPSRLSRVESEAICAQCHLRGDASVAVRGRSDHDFRPGLQLNDFRADYVLEQPDKSMKVVGHVEQMRLSRCYQESDSLTCAVCHDPHDKPSELQRVDHFRQKCLSCHTIEACGLEPKQRKERNAQDNCVACHMPQSPTDIPHFAFTHHRVGIHDSNQNDEHSTQEQIGRLVPLQDLSHLPQLEQIRCLALANLEFSDKQKTPQAHEAYRQRAVRLLERFRQAGSRDGDVEAALARISWEQGDLQNAIAFAADAINSKGTSGATTNALFLLGESLISLNQPGKAIPFLEKLVKLRRQSEDWVLLGLAQRSTGPMQHAMASFERAVAISPTRGDARLLLAEMQQAQGNSLAAAKNRHIAMLLSQSAREEAGDKTPGDTESREPLPPETR